MKVASGNGTVMFLLFRTNVLRLTKGSDTVRNRISATNTTFSTFISPHL